MTMSAFGILTRGSSKMMEMSPETQCRPKLSLYVVTADSLKVIGPNGFKFVTEPRTEP